MIIADILDHLESIAPLHNQEDYDNSGLIAGDTRLECTGVLVSLDCTEAVVQEAIERKCNLIVSHHPLIFRPLRQISPQNATGRTLGMAMRAGICIYAIHTNLDNIAGGVNAAIADKLGLTGCQILAPVAGLEGVGAGMVGNLAHPVSENDFLRILKDRFGVPMIRHSPVTGVSVSRVAICGGAGSFLISNAINSKAEAFVSSDFKYHDFFSAERRILIADIGHFESEQYTIHLLHDVILEKFRNFAVLKSGTVTNPVNYYI